MCLISQEIWWLDSHTFTINNILKLSVDLIKLFCFRGDTHTTVLPTSALQDLGNRATHILNNVQRFFSHHLIDTYGCDYSSSGLTRDSVESKLKSFFQRMTGDGPRFDTYLVYYSGHVYENGDWALAGKFS